MDNRSLREKLEAMAGAHESPQEAAIAREKLAVLGDREPLDAPPPTAVGGLWTEWTFTSSSNAATVTFGGVVFSDWTSFTIKMDRA